MAKSLSVRAMRGLADQTKSGYQRLSSSIAGSLKCRIGPSSSLNSHGGMALAQNLLHSSPGWPFHDGLPHAFLQGALPGGPPRLGVAPLFALHVGPWDCPLVTWQVWQQVGKPSDARRPQPTTHMPSAMPIFFPYALLHSGPCCLPFDAWHVWQQVV